VCLTSSVRHIGQGVGVGVDLVLVHHMWRACVNVVVYIEGLSHGGGEREEGPSMWVRNMWRGIQGSNRGIWVSSKRGELPKLRGGSLEPFFCDRIIRVDKNYGELIKDQSDLQRIRRMQNT